MVGLKHIDMNIIESIVALYENILPKNPCMLPHQEAVEYFERLMMNGNIITYVKDGELIGFLEAWRINFSQLGRILCGLTLEHTEDLLHGNVALITRMYIVPDSRNGEVFINMGRQFLDKNKDATHFIAFQSHKNHKPFQVYTKDQIFNHYRILK